MMYQVENRQTVEVARLEDYLNAFRQRKLVVLTLTMLGLALAMVYVVTAQATYTATAEVQLRPTPVGSTNQNLKEPSLEEERRVVFSDDVASQVRQAYPSVDLDNLQVRFTPDSRILEIKYTDTQADRASQIVQSFASIYADGRTSMAVDHYQRIVDAQTALVQTLDEQRDEQTGRLTALRAEREAAASAGRSVAALDSEISVVNKDIDTTNRARADASRAADGAERDLAGINAERPGRVLRVADRPESPDGIPTSLLLAVGLLMGLVGGLISAFLLERLDTKARDEEDVALALGSQVIGGIPTLGIGHRRGSSSLIMLSTGGSARIEAAREAFRRLRNSLLFLNSSTGVSSVIVTSSSPSEGKSLTAANLAISLAQNGAKVVLVSADLRRPSLERMFGMEAQRAGLAEYLSQTAELNAEKVPGMETLWLIRAGVPPSNPSELLNSDRFEQLIKELEREGVDYIVVDTPPVLSTSDALSAARYVDGVIVVVDSEETDTADLLQVRADLERTGTKLLGAVLNRRKLDDGGLFRRNNKFAYYHAEVGRASGN